MCGRYVISFDDDIDAKEIIRMLNEEYKNNVPKYKIGEIFPSDAVPIIISNLDNKRNAFIFKWGFPGYSGNDLIINARCETLSQKPMFKNLLQSNPCLIPASGFYEWKKEDNKKVKYLIKPQTSNFFYMAGLYNQFIDKTGNTFKSFVIITTNANEEI